MSSIVNKVKDALHSDKNAETQHNTTTTTHPHGTTGTTGTTGAADPRVNTTSHHAPHAPDGTYTAGDNYTHGTTGAAGGLSTGPASNTAGPHSSNLANKADPRVDSDLSGRNNQPISHNEPITHEAYGNNKPGGIAGTAGGLSTGPASNTAGPHSSNLANKVDPRVDSDLDGRNTHGAHGTTHNTTHGTTHGNTHNLGTAGAGTTGGAFGTTGHSTAGNTTAGPHSSNLANKADPRVDSDLDGRNTVGSTTHGTHGTTHSTTHGTHGTHGTAAPLAGAGAAGAAGVAGAGAYSAHTGPASNTAGPHSSNLANKVDPRVDSDLDGSKQLGSNNNNNTTTTHNPAYDGSQGTTHGTHGSSIPLAGAGATGPGAAYGSNTHGTTGTHGHTGTHGTTGTGNVSGYNYDNTGSTNAGPHSSNLANKVDPRVDSDLDGRHAVGSNTHGTHGTTGTHGIGGNHGVAGTHGTHGANTGVAGTHGTHGTNTTGNPSVVGSGPAPKTAGPHKSDLLNKLDPRVDSNLDGSKTVGGDKTHQS